MFMKNIKYKNINKLLKILKVLLKREGRGKDLERGRFWAVGRGWGVGAVELGAGRALSWGGSWGWLAR